MTNSKLILWAIASIGLLLISQISFFIVLDRNARFGSLFLVEESHPSDLLFLDPLNVTLDHSFRYDSGFINKNSFYDFVHFIDNPSPWNLLEVNFTELYSSVDDYGIYSLPLNPNKTYLGLILNNTYFWTLEKSDSWLASSQQLICFSKDQGVISNQTISVTNVSLLTELNEYYRAVFGIQNQILWLLEIGWDYYNSENDFINILAYDIQTLTLINTVNLARLDSNFLYLDIDGIFWYESDPNTRILSSRSNFLGYNLQKRSITKSVNIINGLEQPDYRLSRGEIQKTEPLFIFTNWTLSGVPYNRNLLVFPLEYDSFPYHAPDRFIGFRFYKIKDDHRYSIEVLYWPVGSIVSAGSLILLLRTLWEKKKGIKPRNSSSSISHEE
ncbi:MAG: hypothetical protein EAX86_11125 [Candidatus Heimdallarchaeota archaeon]|nr:hypothetical protein [Candidatus Heimdallarchaeota archaeon]